MLKTGDAYTAERERALGAALAGVAAELRLVDPQDYVAFIRLDLFGNLAHIVASSTELYFKPDTMKSGMSGDIEIGWNRMPRVALDMEFAHAGVTAYFRLILEAELAAIEITYLSFGANGGTDPHANTQRLVDALADARLATPRRSSRLADLAGGPSGEGTAPRPLVEAE